MPSHNSSYPSLRRWTGWCWTGCRWTGVGSLGLAVGLLASSAAAQTSNKEGKTRPKPPPSPAAIRTLDLQADKVRQDFLKGLGELAAGYEEAGQIDKAKEMLESILKIDSDIPAVREKLAEFENQVFDSNQAPVEVDAAKGWSNSGIMVRTDKAIRFEAEGSYRFIINGPVGAEGFPDGDPTQELVSGVRTGALMGMIVAPPKPGERAGERRQQKPPTPFQIGASTEFTPKQDGILFLKLNVPPAAKCIGKVKVTIRGNIRRIAGASD